MCSWQPPRGRVVLLNHQSPRSSSPDPLTPEVVIVGRRLSYSNVPFFNFSSESTASSTMGQATDPGAITSKCDAFSTARKLTSSPSFFASSSYFFPSNGGTTVSCAPVINTCFTRIGNRLDGEACLYLSGTSEGEPPRRFVITGSPQAWL